MCNKLTVSFFYVCPICKLNFEADHNADVTVRFFYATHLFCQSGNPTPSKSEKRVKIKRLVSFLSPPARR